MKGNDKEQYQFKADYLTASEPSKYNPGQLPPGQMIINLGPQHPSTHGVLRLEVLTDGELVLDVVPHLGYLHRCFEKHAQALPYNQVIPYVDRMDYVAAMNSEHAYVMAVEKMLGITGTLPPRVEYIRVLVAELNRIASHFVALGTYAIDIGAFSPFLWMMREREEILRLLEWASGARMLYNYIWVGGLFFDLPPGFEPQVQKFIARLADMLADFETVLLNNEIFVRRTANIGVLPADVAINGGATGPMLRASGVAFDLRRIDGYSVYPHLDFDIPVGQGRVGTLGDCWDRTYVRFAECKESVKIIEQCLQVLQNQHQRTKSFDPQALVPKKIRPKRQEVYFRAENPKGELGFYLKADGRADAPIRCKVRAPSFCNLSILPKISRGYLLADLVAIMGSLDVVMGEVDR